MNHSDCDHEKTKAARAKCRKARAAAKPHISWFVIQTAHAMNDMWSTLNSSQEELLTRYEVFYGTCEICEKEELPLFMFPQIGHNVCGPCERVNHVHEYEDNF